MENVKDGWIKITAFNYASWMYDTEMYDPDEIDRGLLRGYFLRCVSLPLIHVCVRLMFFMVRFTGISLRGHLQQFHQRNVAQSQAKVLCIG